MEASNSKEMETRSLCRKLVDSLIDRQKLDSWVNPGKTQEEREKEFSTKYAHTLVLTVDVESDGPSPATNNLRAVGFVAMDIAQKKVVALGRYAMPDQPGHFPDKRTMEEFWNSKEELKEKWKELCNESAACNDPPQFARDMIRVYLALNDMGYNAIFTSDCIAFDFKYVDHYIREFEIGKIYENPIGYTGFDIYSYAAGVFRCPRELTDNVLGLLKDEKHIKADGVVADHDPLYDALDQACLIADLHRLNDGLPAIKLVGSTSRPVLPLNTMKWAF